jgi:hypothetical protein
MSKPLSVKEMRSQIAKYKKEHCPPLPTKKKDLIKVMELLKLPTSRPFLAHEHTVYSMFHKKLFTTGSKLKGVPVNQTLTKQELIKKITKINNRDPAVYKTWNRNDLQNYLDGGL